MTDFERRLQITEETKERLERTIAAVKESQARVTETKKIIEAERGEER